MNVLVTGANGLLATNIIIQLLAKNYQVSGLIRNPKRFLLPQHPKFKLITGNITDPAALIRAAADCQTIIHCAATTSQDLLRYTDYSETNVTGTRHVINAALKSGVKRVVYISTANTCGYGTMKKPGHEGLPPRPPFTRAWYAKSKLEGQQLALAAIKNLEIVVVSPTFMIGPYDSKPSSGAIIHMGYGKRLIFHPPGGKNFVHAGDVALGAIAAMESGKNGETYLMAGENMSYRAFFKLLARHTGQRTRLIRLPKTLLISLGYLGDMLRGIGIKTALSSTNMRILCIHNYYTNQKAQRELNIHFRTTSQAISDAVGWFRDRGIL